MGTTRQRCLLQPGKGVVNPLPLPTPLPLMWRLCGGAEQEKWWWWCMGICKSWMIHGGHGTNHYWAGLGCAVLVLMLMAEAVPGPSIQTFCSSALSISDSVCLSLSRSPYQSCHSLLQSVSQSFFCFLMLLVVRRQRPLVGSQFSFLAIPFLLFYFSLKVSFPTFPLRLCIVPLAVVLTLRLLAIAFFGCGSWVIYLFIYLFILISLVFGFLWFE